MFLHSYINPSSTKKLPLVDTLISGTRQLEFSIFIFYNKDRSGVGLILNFRHPSRAIIIGCDSYISVTSKPHSPRIDAKLRITLQETKMSTLQNEMIMEDLFDECLCELEQLGHDINKDTTQAVAAHRAQLRFEDMCQ